MIGEKVRGIAEICHGKEIDLIASGYNEDVLPYPSDTKGIWR